MFESSVPPPVPELLIVPLVNVKFVTVVPLTPLPAVFWMFIRSNDGLSVDVSEIPWLVVFWIVPPEFAVPVPRTLRLPLDPVLFSTMPLAAPLADTLLNFNPLAPIVVFATFSAAPGVGVNVLVVLVPVTVPPPLALH